MITAPRMLSNDLHCFFSHNQLSQAVIVPFLYDNKKFFTVNQCLLYLKAQASNEIELAEQIHATNHSVDFRILDSLIPENTTWDNGLLEVAGDVNFEKFSQNESAMELLLSTGCKKLVEVSLNVNDFWGLGMGITEASRTPPRYWTGKNVTGEILTDLRDYFFSRIM